MIDGYVIWDNELNKLWETDAKKKFWNKQNHAANAWHNAQGYRAAVRYIKDQSRFEVRAVKFDFVP